MFAVERKNCVQLKSAAVLFCRWIASSAKDREIAARCRNATRMTSTTATKKPKLKVTTKIAFCLKGNRIWVKIGHVEDLDSWFLKNRAVERTLSFGEIGKCPNGWGIV